MTKAELFQALAQTTEDLFVASTRNEVAAALTTMYELRNKIADALSERAPDPEAHLVADVTPRTVSEWAEGTLQDWLPGYPVHDTTGDQYRIALMDDGTYQVSTADRYGARRFHVLVTVVEVT